MASKSSPLPAPSGQPPVITLIHHNPGITARQVCTALAILPPNLVGLIGDFEKRQFIRREPHPTDGRALGLHLTRVGRTLMRKAERAAAESERDAAALLAPGEPAILMALLQKLYAAKEPAGAG